MTSVVFSIGSNLGDRADHLRFAVRRLAELGEVAAVSGVYETPPWGDTEQPAYYNAVVLMTGEHSVEEWLLHAQRIEHEAGRVRHQARRYSPRTLDVDLVAAWTGEGTPVLRTTPELTLPHPHAHQRAFVLRPWLEVQPYAQLPGHGWVNDLVLADPMAAEVAAMTALPEVRLEVES
ncbi:2-amino-4-hydroxy-6-hydroxymethyldihydropteridine diphosphokinase [Catellatospora sp. TT07R-123]|uniref:2-amino-4-hydroxy-6- hydroxymethyldihydropteridine diphosphokinase n=1 Tax=Catellatospora sp. TT07R-123 TaxID=2733863 RepID=UPI001B2D1170|nr:2-amino-4-hydroxy-6-hydroxymethyldihydropteridine diphosphokinase [Catellatospora sp. TT07R-123]GHJ46450.1 2-amino-4-hydroxy-6-hydroxymethyldihydropteridine diphosphokinase [Catellatospora sp. TT07R-123]